MLPVSLQPGRIRPPAGTLRLTEKTRKVPGPGGPGFIPLALTRLYQGPMVQAAGGSP